MLARFSTLGVRMQPVSAWELGDTQPVTALRKQGFALLGPQRTFELCAVDGDTLARLASSWDRLPSDPHLRDGGSYRFRRHASLTMNADASRILTQVQRPHWQSTEYNALHGGYERWFAPIESTALADPAMMALLTGIGRLFCEAAGHVLPFVEVHQFRIDTASGIGRPTPEGAHRDGVDFVAVILIARHAVRGGETRVFQAHGAAGLRFTMHEPGAALLLDDQQVIHETTPLQPDGQAGYRDTLVLTYRRDGFLDPAKP